MAEFVVDGHKYVSRKIPPMQAVHVLRRVSPFIPSLGYYLPVREMFVQMTEDMEAVLAGGTASISTEDVDAIASSITPTLQMLAAMPDADVDVIFTTCFSVVQRQQDSGYADIWEPKTRQPMFPDIESYTMIAIVWEVLKENIGPLAEKLLSKSAADTPASDSTPSA